MDRLAYVAMTGAKNLMHQQEVLANNLANANVAGFRADYDAFRAVPTNAPNGATRTYAVETTPGSNFAPGPIQHTGNALDAAIDGSGFFVVQAQDGTEAYTRAGAFLRSADGTLSTPSGRPVIGDGGPIQVPENASIEIAKDGTVSAATPDNPGKPQQLGRLKLVNPDVKDLAKGADGLFRSKSGEASADESVRLVGQSIEGSNVNVIDTLVGMISLARQFEMQMKFLSDTDQASKESATRLLAP